MITTFILDGVISNYIIIDCILFYFYFHEQKYPFWIGLCYDIIYTDTLFLHAFLFLFVSYSISKIKEKSIFNFILILISYHVLEYSILILMKSHIFHYRDLVMLFQIILVNSFIIILLNWIHKKRLKA